jgi:hypothetical protein
VARRFVVLLALAGLLVGCGGQSQASKEEEARRTSFRLVGLYCLYGSRSQPQLLGCIHHVDPSYVLHSNTAAARFARSDRLKCGEGSGPLCNTRTAERFSELAENARLGDHYSR